ncbi:MAG: protein-L-isoaspartate(D-aspartate) O-methyltransferase [Gammaproteobacteria bacterium]
MKAEHIGIGMTSQRARDRLVQQLLGMGISHPRVLEVMRTTPRHIFVDEALASRAYENSALPIGHGQTISQPYVVARMTEALVASGSMDRVLEIGAGCGYQTVILAQFAKRVFSVERVAALAEKLRDRIRTLSYPNVRIKHADGGMGWPEHSPYDAILAAAAPVGVPSALRDQLKLGGRLVIPVGGAGKQQLILVTRSLAGYTEQHLDWVSFVPMMQGLG